MRRLGVLAIVSVVFTALVGCGSSGHRSYTIAVDHELNEFPSSYFGYFPRVVSVHAGDNIVFKQAWTGEPHTVTFGNAFKSLAAAVAPLITGSGQFNDAERQALSAATAQVPSVFDANHTVNQTLATSCYVASGPIPTNGAVCKRRSLPAFNGRETVFNSGFIPYQGTKGNSFGMTLADDIKPGDYFFYCALHGPTMGGFLRVVAKNTTAESTSGVRRRRDTEVSAATSRLRATHQSLHAVAGESADIIAGGFTASGAALQLPFGTVNDFEPHTFQAKVGQAVTWFVPRGPGHTISFGAPKDLPSVRIDPGGYQVNPKAFEAQGGPGYPSGHAATSTADVNGGNYDGSFFLSSGFPYGPMRYSITFTKPGTYNYVCLLHPKMDGTVVVS